MFDDDVLIERAEMSAPAPAVERCVALDTWRVIHRAVPSRWELRYGAALAAARLIALNHHVDIYRRAKVETEPELLESFRPVPRP
jgi:hypothetical protein